MSDFSWNLWADLMDMLSYPFMRNAFAAGTLIALVAGIVSYFVVLRRSSFAAHALGHIGFAGAAGAVLLGVSPIFGLLAFTTASGTGIAFLGKRATHRDVEIGAVLAFMLALGVLFISLYSGYATEAYSILFGEILGISSGELLLTYLATLAVLLAVLLVYRPLLFASLDEEVAEAKGMRVVLLGLVFMLVLAVAVSIAVQVVGVLLIFSLLVIPAAISFRLARRPIDAIVISVVVALTATWVGLFVSWYIPYPVSFFITAIVFAIYLGVRFGLAPRGHRRASSPSELGPSASERLPAPPA